MFGGADHRLVDSFGTPDEVGAVFESEEARGEFAGADHRGKNNFVAVVDSIFGDGDAFGGGDHDGNERTQSREHIISFQGFDGGKVEDSLVLDKYAATSA